MAGPSLRSLAREPLVHFLVAGAALALLEHVTHHEGETPSPTAIVVDDGVRRALADAWAHEHGVPPSEDELATLVSRWVDEEVLYRAGLERGLDRDDPRVRQRVATRMAALIEAEHPVPDPTEEEIRAYFDAHAERWAREPRLDFVHVFVDGTGPEADVRAEALRVELEAGASRVGLGDPFSGGRHYRDRRLADLTEAFGEEFTNGLEDQPLGVWTIRRSRHGTHVVLVERHAAAATADFAAARIDVERELTEEAHAERTARAIAELRTRFEVVER